MDTLYIYKKYFIVFKNRQNCLMFMALISLYTVHSNCLRPSETRVGNFELKPYWEWARKKATIDFVLFFLPPSSSYYVENCPSKLLSERAFKIKFHCQRLQNVSITKNRPTPNLIQVAKTLAYRIHPMHFSKVITLFYCSFRAY